jgi:hypothetical protein
MVYFHLGLLNISQPIICITVTIIHQIIRIVVAFCYTTGYNYAIKEYEMNIKTIALAILVSLFTSGCTQIITAPIKIVGAVACAAIDVTGSAVHAVAGSDDKKKKKSD